MTCFKLIVLTEYLATEDEIRSIFRPYHHILKARELAWGFHLNSTSGLLSADLYGSGSENAVDSPMPAWIVAVSSIQDVNRILATCNLRFIPNNAPSNQIFIFEYHHRSYESPHHSIHVGYIARIIYHLPDDCHTDVALHDLVQPFGGIIHLVYVLRGIGGVVHFSSEDDAQTAEATARRIYPTLEFHPMPLGNVRFSSLWDDTFEQSYGSSQSLQASYNGSLLYSASLVRGVRLFLSKKRERSPVSIFSASSSEGDTDPAKLGVSTPPADPLYLVLWVYTFILVVLSGLSDIVRPASLPASPNSQQTAQDNLQVNTGRTSLESGHDPLVQDMASRMAKSIMRLNQTFLDTILGSTGSLLTDLMDQNRKDLKALMESTDLFIRDLETRFLERMEHIQKLEGIILALNKEVQQANATAHVFQQAKEANHQEHKAEVDDLKMTIGLLEADIRELQDSLAESKAYCTSIDEDSLHWRVRCRTAEGKIARMIFRLENGETANS